MIKNLQRNNKLVKIFSFLSQKSFEIMITLLHQVLKIKISRGVNMKNIMRKLIEKYISLDVSYEKGISYFREMINSDNNISKLYKNIKSVYKSKLMKGTLNIKYEKLKIQERQGKLKGSGEDFQFSYFVSIFAVLFTFLFQSLFNEAKYIVPVAVAVILVVLISEIIKRTKLNRSINMTLAISLMVLEELEKEQVKSLKKLL